VAVIVPPLFCSFGCSHSFGVQTLLVHGVQWRKTTPHTIMLLSVVCFLFLEREQMNFSLTNISFLLLGTVVLQQVKPICIENFCRKKVMFV
jgi:hypothetical protein